MNKTKCLENSFVDPAPPSWKLKNYTRWHGSYCEAVATIVFVNLNILEQQLQVTSFPYLPVAVIREGRTLGICVTAKPRGNSGSDTLTVNMPFIKSFTGDPTEDQPNRQITWTFQATKKSYEVEVRGTLGNL